MLRRLEASDLPRPFDALGRECQEVDRLHGRVPAGSRGGRNQVVTLAKGEDRRDVSPGEYVFDQAARFRLADHVGPCVGCVIRILVLKVAIQVHAAVRILVEEAVAVVVESFPVDRVAAGFSLGRVRAAQEPRIIRMHHERPPRILHAHD